MGPARGAYHQNRLGLVKKALEANRFEATVHETLEGAAEYLIGTILPSGPYATVAFGGSDTVIASGIVATLRALPGVSVTFDRNDRGLSPGEWHALTRDSILVDLFVASSNAVTQDGRLVNVDRYGNRVAAIAYGPRKVALLVGRNKIVPDLQGAMERARSTAAAMNAIRIGETTPCAKTARCHDCHGKGRLCGVTSITERSFPPGRVHVLLIDQDLGF
ncbi:MAG: lactate utilization protein [Deltaproteobacteria bacterium]|jgi:hypothetical protein|nr:lactate utilization protein [Deltaproteobacteria bacterium]